MDTVPYRGNRMRSLNQANILLVDDRPENLLALEAVLSDLGENLVTAGSGREALERLQEQEFAAILLDVQMPGLDGFATAQRIREQPRSHDTPIIFLTAIYGERKYAAQGYAVGAVDYIAKPFAPEVLKARVGAITGAYKQGQEAALRAEARHAAILEAALDAIISIDHEGRVIEWNPAAARTFGYAETEAAGQLLGDLIVPPELRESHRHGLARYLNTGEAHVVGRRVEVTALHR